jgi:ATP-binding cassette subfamily B protein
MRFINPWLKNSRGVNVHNFGYFEEGQVGKISDFSLWKRLLLYCRNHVAGLALAVLLSFVVTVATLAMPRIMQMAIDGCMIDPAKNINLNLDKLAGFSRMYGVAVLAAFAAGFVQVVLLEYIGQSIMHRLRNDLYRHVLDLDLAFFHAHPTGRLVTRLTNDIQNMHEMFTSVMVTLFNDFLKLAGILAVLVVFNVRLGLVMALFFPLALLLTMLFSRLARERFRAIRSQLAVLNSFLQETVSAISVVQLFGRQKQSAEKFREHNREYLGRTLSQIKLFGTFMPLTEFLGALATAIILWYGGGQVIQERLTLGELVAFFSYMRLFFQPMRELSQKYSIVQSAMASAERIFQILDQTGSIRPPAKPYEPVSIAGDICFDAVSFSYRSDEPVLNNISLQIKSGETVAVVGSSGAGKSTLMSLLVRFYDPVQGTLYLDGHRLTEFSPAFLREKIGIVLQDVLIEPATVFANIVLGTGKDMPFVQKILSRTGMDVFVSRLPQGLSTMIGEGGHDLSAGEKQLLAFARVLCRDPAVLILDEATSSVDTVAENLLEQAVQKVFKGRTSLIIAHRLSTVRRADRILVMDRGRIVEQGSHEELIAAKGVYAGLLLQDWQEKRAG